jgi:L-alanine-DL-glutamate epimerase-like enolase superfamily enzyme
MGKIKDVRLTLREYTYHKPFHITGSISCEANNVDVELFLDNGIVAKGEASPSFRVNGERVEMLLALESFLKESLIGLDVRNYARIFEITDKLLAAPSLKAAVQFATLDGLCEELGITVSEFLGGAKTEIETDKTVGIDTVENRVKDAEEIFKEGFRTIKVKVGENLKEDINAMLEIARVTKGAKYIVDANMGYTPKQAVEFANVLYRSGVDIAVYEQPVVWYDVDGLKYVRLHCRFPVAADESAKRKYDVLGLIKEEAVDYVNIKLMKSGISDALAIIEMAKASNIKLMIGCMAESSLGINQSVQFALGTGAFDFHDLDSHLLLKEPSFRGKFVQDGPKMKLR